MFPDYLLLLFKSVYPQLFLASFLEGNSIITAERQFLLIPAELWLAVPHKRVRWLKSSARLLKRKWK